MAGKEGNGSRVNDMRKERSAHLERPNNYFATGNLHRGRGGLCFDEPHTRFKSGAARGPPHAYTLMPHPDGELCPWSRAAGYFTVL